jgi:hypothetical protein
MSWLTTLFNTFKREQTSTETIVTSSNTLDEGVAALNDYLFLTDSQELEEKEFYCIDCIQWVPIHLHSNHTH